MNGTRLLLPALLTASLLLPSCRVFRRSKADASAPRPTLKMPPAPPPKVERVSLPEPPIVEPQEPDLDQELPPLEGQTPPPYRRPRPTGTARNREAPDPAQPAAGQPPVETPAPPVPQLEEVLSPEQQQAYNEAIDRNISRAQKTVTALKDKRLNGEQSTYLDRIRTFIQQAIEARKTDLFRAKNLAERASVLAEDLLRSAP